MKTFFKMIKYEAMRVVRNKVVLTMLLSFSIILLLIISFVQVDTKNYPIAIFTDGVDINDVGVMDVIEENIQFNRVTFVDSKEEGLKLVKRGRVCFFICLDAGENLDDTTAVFYYDQSSTIGRTVKNNVSDAKNEFAYDTITEFLDKYGIKLKESYFQLVTFEPTSTNTIEVTQVPFAMEVGICVAIVLMFGLAYSMSRDNETNVSKNLSYMPVGTNRYLMSKVVPYYLLGFAQLVVLYSMGSLFFKIHFQINILLAMLLTSVFVLAVIAMGLIFSLLKSQIATIFIDMLTIVLPMFILTMVYVQATPIFVQILLYCFPVVPFVRLLNGMMFNGVILWWQIGVLLVQVVVYYLIAMLILKRRVKE
ncbi:MAG: ABC transporter permease [Clostridia bacterium]